MILFGKPVAEKIYESLKDDILKLRESNLHLAVVLVGEDPASLSYVGIKEKRADELGINIKVYHLPAIARQSDVETLISDLNCNKYIAGIILQLPLPKDFDTDLLINKIAPEKDIDGFQKKYKPPTAQAIIEILKFYEIDYKKSKIAIIGRGKLVGEPLEYLLKKEKITPFVCDSKTENLKNYLLNSDIIISAAGVAGIIRKDMISENSIVIDAGASESGGKLVGDVLPEVYEKVKTYTPVPGGVGPVTVACLLKNFIEAVKNV